MQPFHGLSSQKQTEKNKKQYRISKKLKRLVSAVAKLWRINRTLILGLYILRQNILYIKRKNFAKTKRFNFYRETLVKKSFLKNIPVVNFFKYILKANHDLISFILHMLPFSYLLESRLEHIRKLSRNKTSGSFSNSVYHLCKQKHKN